VHVYPGNKEVLFWYYDCSILSFVSLGSGFRVLDSAVGLSLFSFFASTTFNSISNVLLCVVFSCKGWHWLLCIAWYQIYNHNLWICFFIYYVIINVLHLILLYNWYADVICLTNSWLPQNVNMWDGGGSTLIYFNWQLIKRAVNPRLLIYLEKR
jgi:hypothetical protein